jgi:sentrin-specific protease 1
MSLLSDRDARLCESNPGRKRSVFFNSYFMARLLPRDGEYHYDAVSRWLRKELKTETNIFELRKVYVPINIDNEHWTIVVVSMERKSIFYYDSFHSKGCRYVKAVWSYLIDHAKDMWLDSNYINSVLTGWTSSSADSSHPRQTSGSDCGVFSVMCADFLSDDLDLEYRQDSMQFFRTKICADILRGYLNYPLHRDVCCDRCGKSHESSQCPHFRHERLDHPDAQVKLFDMGDTSSSTLPGSLYDSAEVEVVQQPPDGSCLLHSISYGLEDGTSARVLREECCNFIRLSGESFTVNGNSLSQWIFWDCGRTCEGYVEDVQKPTTWCGGIEMACISHLRKCSIHVYKKNEEGKFMRITAFSYGQGKGKTIRVLYKGNNHYDALKVSGVQSGK